MNLRELMGTSMSSSKRISKKSGPRDWFLVPVNPLERIKGPKEPGEDNLRDEAREKYWRMMAASSKGRKMLEDLQLDVLPLYRYQQWHGAANLWLEILPDWASTYHLLQDGQVPDWVVAIVESTLMDWSEGPVAGLVKLLRDPKRPAVRNWALTGEHIVGQ